MSTVARKWQSPDPADRMPSLAAPVARFDNGKAGEDHAVILADDCFIRALRCAFDLHNSEGYKGQVRLVHAVVDTPGSPNPPHWHAWVEATFAGRRLAFDVLPNRERIYIEAEDYRKQGHVEHVHEYRRSEWMSKAHIHQTYGPWAAEYLDGTVTA